MAVIVAGAFLVILSQRGIITPLQDLGLRILSPFTAALDGLGELLSGDSGATQSALELRIEELENEITVLRERASRVADLEDMLGFTSANPESELLGAKVIQRNSSNFVELISINVGSEDRVRQGMIVLSPAGSLAGQVIEVRGDSSIVRLITSPSIRVDAYLPSSDNEPTVARSNGPDELTLDLVEKDINVVEGDSVITSGRFGRFPDGLLIGVVKEVSQSDELFLRIVVDPSAPLLRLDTVMVLLDFTPSALDLDQ